MESKRLQISENLRNILIDMSDRCDLAKMLISDIKMEYLIQDHVDFIDLASSDNNKLSYLTKERISKIDKDGLNFWTSINLRYQSKPGALLGKIFNKNILDNKRVENFVNLFKSIVAGDKYNFTIVDGSQIKSWYSGQYYSSNSGSLGNSCMKHDGCQNFFDIYINNNVKMLIMTDSDGMLFGRALIWEAIDDLTGNLVKVLDRIYTINDDELSPIFKKWATKNDYIYRQNQNWTSSLHWVESGNVVEKRMSIKLSSWDFNAYPYLDSFKFFNKNTGVLTNYIPDGFIDDRTCKVLISAEGKYLDNSTLVMDDITHYFIHRNDCARLENEGIYTSYDNVFYSSIMNKYILRTDGIYCEEIDDHIYLVWERNPEHVQEFVSKRKEEIKREREEIEKRRSSSSKFSSTSVSQMINMFSSGYFLHNTFNEVIQNNDVVSSDDLITSDFINQVLCNSFSDYEAPTEPISENESEELDVTD